MAAGCWLMATETTPVRLLPWAWGRLQGINVHVSLGRQSGSCTCSQAAPATFGYSIQGNRAVRSCCWLPAHRARSASARCPSLPTCIGCHISVLLAQPAIRGAAKRQQRACSQGSGSQVYMQTICPSDIWHAWSHQPICNCHAKGTSSLHACKSPCCKWQQT